MRECEHCGAILDPQEVCDCRRPEAQPSIALQCVSPPVISENIAAITAYIDDTLLQLSALEPTREGCSAAKALRADLRRHFDVLESQRKAVKNAVMEPYLAAEKAYKEKIATPMAAADSQLKDWIDAYQNAVKESCREELQAYFDELCDALHIDFVTFDQTGVVVDMATANLKDPKKARNTIHDFLNRVEEDRRTIAGMEHAGEIMAEYRQSLSLSAAIAAVNDRHERIAQTSADMEALKSSANAATQDHTAARPTNILAAPTVEPVDDPVLRCTFTVKATRKQLGKIKELLIQEGIEFE